MTTEQFALVGLSTMSGVMGWLLREVWEAVKRLRADLDDLRVNIAETYIRRDTLKDVLQPIQEQLNRIEAALIHKADK